jgi:hypothetical protein
VVVIKRLLYLSLAIVALSIIGRFTSGKFWFEDRSSDAAEIVHLKYKIGHRNETLLIYTGVIQNKPELLELSRVEHQYRDEPFEFVKWAHADKIVETMFKLEAWDCLEWVMRQPNWYSCLNEKTYSKLVKFSEDLNAVNLKKAAQLK